MPFIPKRQQCNLPDVNLFPVYCKPGLNFLFSTSHDEKCCLNDNTVCVIFSVENLHHKSYNLIDMQYNKRH